MELIAILENRHILHLPNVKSTCRKDNGITIVHNMENEFYASLPANAAVIVGEDLTPFIKDIQENQNIITTNSLILYAPF